jgi:predicted RND superfamily exporter protein
VAGLGVLTSFASTTIIGSLRNGLTAAILINIAVIGFAFRSWRVAAISIVPNFLPILGTELYLYVSGAGLQMTTVIALTIAFGIAVDDTIHFLSTYMRLRRAEISHEEAVDTTLERVGPALVATTLILCAGTFVVVFSALPQVALFGTLTVLTLVLALLGDLIVLPALLLAGGRYLKTLGVKK